MPTPADLREALNRLEAEAPDAAPTRSAVLRRVGSESRRPRWTYRNGPLLVAAVAILVALATVVVLTVRDAGLDEPAGRPSAPPAVPLTWTFDLPEPPAGTTLLRVSISPDRQEGFLARTDGGEAMSITVHAPGTFDPATDLTSPRRVTVLGRDGYFGPLGKRPDGSLVWPTDEGGWVELYGFGVVTNDTSGSVAEPEEILAEQLSVAPLVQFGRFGSPTLPFRLGWLPSGVSVQGVRSGTQGLVIDATFGTAVFGDGGSSTPGVGTISVFRIAYSRSFAEEIADVVGPGSTELTVNGRPAVMGPAGPIGPDSPVQLDARVLAVDLGDGSAFLVYVGNPAVERYPDEVLRRIVEEADVSMSMADPSTWIPAPEAVRG